MKFFVADNNFIFVYVHYKKEGGILKESVPNIAGTLKKKTVPDVVGA